MQQENFESPEGTYDAHVHGAETATGEAEGNGGVAMREKMSRRAEDVNRRINDGMDRSRAAASERLKTTSKTIEDLSERLSGGLERAGESARQGLHATSRRVNDFATYLEERDSRQMWDDTKEVVRRHPGKSIIAGLAVGLLVGRILR